MGDKLKVILVDDHDLLRQGLKMLLKKADHIEIIAEAKNGEDAVHLARNLAHDMVIMDFQMPQMDGIEACQCMIKNDPKEKVLILSAHKEDMLVRRILAAGAKGFISKESDLQEFLAAIKSITQNKIYLSQNMRHNRKARLRKRQSRRQKINAQINLSKRELQIIQLVSDGLKSQDIAEECGLSIRTIEAHRRNITKKLGLSSFSEVIKFCLKMGYVK